MSVILCIVIILYSVFTQLSIVLFRLFLEDFYENNKTLCVVLSTFWVITVPVILIKWVFEEIF